jgi:FlaA1/EpsC-like NDP-sugar epimerase
VKDLIELFAEKYKKNIVVTNIRPGEKMHESLINDSQFTRTLDMGKYHHTKSNYKYGLLNENYHDYNSNLDILPKEQLGEYLRELNLL